MVDNIRRSFVTETTGILAFLGSYVSESGFSWVASAIAHDGAHVAYYNEDKMRGGDGYSFSRGEKAEHRALMFQRKVGGKVGLSQKELRYLDELISNPASLQDYFMQNPHQ